MDSGFPFGIALLVAAGFFGYLLGLLQHRVGMIASSQNDRNVSQAIDASSPYVKHFKSVRPPLIPSEDEQEKQEEGFFGSLGKLLANAGASVIEIWRGLIPGLRKKPGNYHYQYLQQQQQKQSTVWPVQDSYVIRDEDEPPLIEARTPTPKKTYPFMAKDAEKVHQLRQGRAFYSGWDGDFQQQKQQQHHRSHSSIPHTYYEQVHEKTNEIVFGAVQEQGRKHEAAVIKPVNYGDSVYNHHGVRSRTNYSIGF